MARGEYRALGLAPGFQLLWPPCSPETRPLRRALPANLCLEGRLEREIAVNEACSEDQDDDEGVDERIHAPSLAPGPGFAASRSWHFFGEDDSAIFFETAGQLFAARQNHFREIYECHIPAFQTNFPQISRRHLPAWAPPSESASKR